MRNLDLRESIIVKVKMIKLIYDAVQAGTPENQVMLKIRDMIKSIPDFNIREKAWLYRTVKRAADLMYVQEGRLENSQIKNYSVRLNKIEEHANSRKRKMNLVTEMRDNRARGGVFYMTSIHSNPAEDHKDYQGVIYVDRFWRSVLEDDTETRDKVEAYIRNHDTMTVQEVCGPPVYMITRPYCKHFFIELDTDEVLGSSVNKIRKEHSEVNVRTHNINYRKKYYKFREKIHTVLNMESDAAHDRVLIKRQS